MKMIRAEKQMERVPVMQKQFQQRIPGRRSSHLV